MILRQIPSQMMLMAAGLGTRLRPFTDTYPKALVPILGIPVARFALDAAKEFGIQKTIVNVHHESLIAKKVFQSFGYPIEVSDESALLMGSAGGLRQALDFFDEGPILVMNADVMVDLSLEKLALQHARNRVAFGADLTMHIHPKGPGKYSELFFETHQNIQRIDHISDQPASGRPFFSGVSIIEKSALKNLPLHQPSDFVSSILRPALEVKRVGAYVADGLWFDVGDPTHWYAAHLNLLSLLELGKIPNLWRHLIESQNVRIQSEFWMSRLSRRPLGLARGPGYFNTQDQVEDVWPSVVLYGNAPHNLHELGSGIGFRDHFVKC